MKISTMSNRRGIVRAVLFTCFVCGISPSLVAKECFEKSPAIEKGEDIYNDQSVSRLSQEQYKNLQGIFKAAEGSWTGTMSVKECFGTSGSLTVKMEDYEVKAETKFDGQLFESKTEMYSLKSKTRKTTTMNYLLTEEYLSIDGRQTGISEVLTTTTAGASYYKRFRQTQAGKPGSFVKEVFNVVEASGREVAIKEYQYINGELVSESISKLQ